MAPRIAAEFRTIWHDLHLASRLVEEYLGGEKGVQLEMPTILELVRIYEYLEDQRELGVSPSGDPRTLGTAIAGAN
jgi:hypothetical protein